MDAALLMKYYDMDIIGLVQVSLFNVISSWHSCGHFEALQDITHFIVKMQQLLVGHNEIVP